MHLSGCMKRRSGSCQYYDLNHSNDGSHLLAYWHSMLNHRRTRLSSVISICLFGLVLIAPPAHATIDNLKSYKQAYPGKDAKAYSCKVCHQNPIGRKDDLNAYGLALQKLPAPANPKKLTEPDYRLLESLDTERAAEAPAASAEPAKAEYVGADTCAMCHAKQAEEFKHSTHARIAIPGEVGTAQGCETCHGPGSLHVEAGGGRGVGGIINPRKDPSTCFGCHLDKRAEFRLPYHHPVMEGKMSCADCNNAHAPDVRPWSATSVEAINEACFKCHKDQRGPFVYEHEALREGCTTCHKVHGSIHQKMLLVRDHNLCLRCHTQTNFPTIGDSNHGSSARFSEGTCFSGGCHTAPHGSNFDDHLRY